MIAPSFQAHNHIITLAHRNIPCKGNNRYGTAASSSYRNRLHRIENHSLIQEATSSMFESEVYVIIIYIFNSYCFI